jgi:peptidoglycan-N-acetylglucosamine deacetylase
MYFLDKTLIKEPAMNKKIKSALFCAAVLSFLSAAYAGETPFSVVPWNGYKSAVSLTFDDGDPIHLDLVIPEMQKRNMKGTFFLIADKIQRLEEWQKAAAAGMEIGNHTSNHKHAYELSAADEKYETDNAEKFLQEQFKQPVITFAFPFVEITDGLMNRIQKYCIMARGGGPGMYYTQDMEPDWYNIHSQATMTDLKFDTYKDWIDQAANAGAWSVFMIHAIEGSNWFQPVPKDTFIKFLDYLDSNKAAIWIASFGEIGAYWKAQKTIENSKGARKNGAYIIKWEKPKPFPAGVILKIRVDTEGNTITQAGSKVEPVSPGIYPISFDAGELTITPPKKNLKL